MFDHLRLIRLEFSNQNSFDQNKKRENSASKPNSKKDSQKSSNSDNMNREANQFNPFGFFKSGQGSTGFGDITPNRDNNLDKTRANPLEHPHNTQDGFPFGSSLFSQSSENQKDNTKSADKPNRERSVGSEVTTIHEHKASHVEIIQNVDGIGHIPTSVHQSPIPGAPLLPIHAQPPGLMPNGPNLPGVHGPNPPGIRPGMGLIQSDPVPMISNKPQDRAPGDPVAQLDMHIVSSNPGLPVIPNGPRLIPPGQKPSVRQHHQNVVSIQPGPREPGIVPIDPIIHAPINHDKNPHVKLPDLNVVTIHAGPPSMIPNDPLFRVPGGHGHNPPVKHNDHHISPILPDLQQGQTPDQHIVTINQDPSNREIRPPGNTDHHTPLQPPDQKLRPILPHPPILPGIPPQKIPLPILNGPQNALEQMGKVLDHISNANPPGLPVLHSKPHNMHSSGEKQKPREHIQQQSVQEHTFQHVQIHEQHHQEGPALPGLPDPKSRNYASTAWTFTDTQYVSVA